VIFNIRGEMLARVGRIALWGALAWEVFVWGQIAIISAANAMSATRIGSHALRRKAYIEEREQPGGIMSPDDAELLGPDGRFDQDILQRFDGTYYSLNEIKEVNAKTSTGMKEELQLSIIFFVLKLL
jgi:hypothetical protein